MKINKFGTSLVALITLILLTGLLLGEEKIEETPMVQGKKGGKGYFLVGNRTLDIKGLNSRLKNAGYATLSDKSTSLGGGGHCVIKNKWIIGGEGHSFLGDEVSSGNYKISLKGGYGFFKLGYVLYSKKNWQIYPMLGLGGGGMEFQILAKEAPPFNEILGNPQRGVELSTGGFLLNLSLGINYHWILKTDEKCEGGLVFGLCFGYTWAPSKSWELDEKKISGGPRVGITGPYFTIIIGGGGRCKK